MCIAFWSAVDDSCSLATFVDVFIEEPSTYFLTCLLYLVAEVEERKSGEERCHVKAHSRA